MKTQTAIEMLIIEFGCRLLLFLDGVLARIVSARRRVIRHAISEFAGLKPLVVGFKPPWEGLSDGR